MALLVVRRALLPPRRGAVGVVCGAIGAVRCWRRSSVMCGAVRRDSVGCGEMLCCGVLWVSIARAHASTTITACLNCHAPRSAAPVAAKRVACARSQAAGWSASEMRSQAACK